MTTRVLSLSEFLLARINDDEAEARRAADGPFSITSTPYGETFGIVTAGGGDYLEEQWFAVDPARVLAECDSKRQIVEGISGLPFENALLRRLALPYADHPDYRGEWKP